MTAAAPKPALPGSLNANRLLSQWIGFDKSGRVSIRPGKVEIGQGIVTALAQIAADELDVAFERIDMQPATTATSPNEGVTSGSRSVTESGMALRHACAAARQIFLSVTAQRTGVPLDRIEVVDGRFIGPSGEIGSYWADADTGLLACEAPAKVKIKSAAERSIAGTTVARIDLPDKVFGLPRFIHDLRLPGMIFARVVRPATRGARLVEAPEAPAGCSLVIDGNFVAVAADTEATADAAATKLAARIRWDERDTLPEQTEMRAFLRASPAEKLTLADQPGRAAPTQTLRTQFYRPYLSHASIGVCCAVARFADDRLEVWSHSQSIFLLRKDLARVLGLPIEAVTVHHREGAGCYGHNGADDVALDASLVARAHPGSPVRLQWSRADELGWSPFSSAMLVEIEAGVDAKGDLVDWKHEVFSNGHLLRPGNFDSPSLLAAAELATPFEAPIAQNPPLASGGGADRNAFPIYRTGGLTLDIHRLLDMPIRVSSLRGLGAMVNVLAIEATMDELAATAGRDPVEYRLTHLDDQRAKDVIEAVVAMAGPRPAAPPDGYGRGLAFARYKGTSAYCAVVAEIEAEEQVRVRRLWIAADAGEVINPEGAAHQIEGGAVQACSFALKEAVTFDRRGITSNAWETYQILRFEDVPQVMTQLLPRPDLPPVGVGECATGPTVAAIANAIHDALGVRPRTMPFTADNLSLDMGNAP
ncbi:MAG: xanthine dehydrogenase family protein molybdopterin-binding subunit [Xanthobacteraceae bacterium]|nr:xanthine dehydrogenase family protein molybdopterin-binding subunit [Xanthobacteraceae bacterium]